MSVIYPRPIESCPTYLNCGGIEQINEVCIANNFGKQSEYNIGDKVETISFYFADSQSHKQNHVRIEQGILEDIKIFETHTSYYVKCRNCTIITPIKYIRPIKGMLPYKGHAAL